MSTGGVEDPDEVRRYRLAFGRGARSVAWVHARASAAGLEKALGLLDGGRGPLDVRVVSWDGWPVVRADLCVDGAERLAELFARDLGGGGPNPDATAVAAAYNVLPEEGRGPQAVDDIDVAELNPGWNALRPGVKYLGGYRRAWAAATALNAVIRPALLAGPMSVDWDAWEDGQGTVHLDLGPGDAVRLTAMVGYLVEKYGPQLCGGG